MFQTKQINAAEQAAHKIEDAERLMILASDILSGVSLHGPTNDVHNVQMEMRAIITLLRHNARETSAETRRGEV